jgi:hypothetical protein
VHAEGSPLALSLAHDNAEIASTKGANGELVDAPVPVGCFALGLKPEPLHGASRNASGCRYLMFRISA